MAKEGKIKKFFKSLFPEEGLGKDGNIGFLVFLGIAIWGSVINPFLWIPTSILALYIVANSKPIRWVRKKISERSACKSTKVHSNSKENVRTRRRKICKTNKKEPLKNCSHQTTEYTNVDEKTKVEQDDLSREIEEVFDDMDMYEEQTQEKSQKQKTSKHGKSKQETREL